MVNLQSVKARLKKHQLLSAQFEKPLTMFHGTSSKYLRSILKHGLMPSAKEGCWVEEDKDASEHSRSRISYGGVYFTNNLQTALSAASNLIIHQEGSWQTRQSNQIVVCVQLQPSTTIGDEDDYKSNLFNEVRVPETMIPNVLALLRAGIKHSGGYDAPRWNKQAYDYIQDNVKGLISKYAPNYDLRDDKAKLQGSAQEVLLTELERQVAYRSVRAGNKPHYSFERDTKQILDRMSYSKGGWPYDKPLPQAMRPQSKEKAEQRARSALDLFIKATKTYSKQNLEEQRDATYTRGTTRTLDPVSFRGSNKITCIIEFTPSKTEKYGDDLVVHYGIVPDELKRQYIKFKGPWPVVFNKGGEAIKASDNYAITKKWPVKNINIQDYYKDYLEKDISPNSVADKTIKWHMRQIKKGKYDPIVIGKYLAEKPRPLENVPKVRVLDGTHRLIAAHRLGLKTIKAYVQPDPQQIEASDAQNADKYSIKYVRTESDGLPGTLDYYHIDFNGKPIVPFRISNLDFMLEIDIDDGYENRINKLGPTVLRKLLKDIKKLYPKAEKLVGLRTTGARAKSGKAWDEASIKLQAAASDIRIELTGKPEKIVEPFGGQTNTIYKFNIFKTGERLNCQLTIVVESSEPNKGYFIIDGTEKNNLGTAGLRQVFRLLKSKYPKLKQLYGTRVTGAKRVSGKADRSVVYDLSKL